MENKKEDSFEYIFKSNKLSRKQYNESLNWLNSEFNNNEEIIFGNLYRISYEYKNYLNPTKVILPIQFEIENDETYLICFDILDMINILRATLFDLITKDNKLIQIDDKLFNVISKNRLIRKSVKKLIFKNIKIVNSIKYYDLLNILYLPIIKSKD